MASTGPSHNAPDASSTSSYNRHITSTLHEITRFSARQAPARPPSKWGLSSSATIPPAPPLFREHVDEMLNNQIMGPDVHDYYSRVKRADDPAGQRGMQSPVVQLLQEDAVARVRGRGGRRTKRLVWEVLPGSQQPRQDVFGHIKIWRVVKEDGEKVHVVIKTEKQRTFVKDWIHEAELTRRLNLAGCNEVITVIDWTTTTNETYKICYEYASHGDLDILIDWYTDRQLILPECFLWHVLKYLSSALAYLVSGTNTGHTIPHWEPTVHGDLKEKNIFLFAPSRTSNAHYPYPKIADLGNAFNTPTTHPTVAQYQARARDGYGTTGYIPPEGHNALKNSPRLYEAMPASAVPTPPSDIWTLGLIMRRLISLINVFVPESMYRELVSQGAKRPFYSPALNRLVEQCMALDAGTRPSASDIYRVACHFHDLHCGKLGRREAHAREKGEKVFLGQVLYRREDQDQFDEHYEFRRDYEEANRGPLRDWLGVERWSWETLDPGKGPVRRKPLDLRVEPLELKVPGNYDEKEKKNTRLVLQDEEFRRWVSDYYEAAAALVRPRKKPAALAVPTEAIVRVMNARFDNAPVGAGAGMQREGADKQRERELEMADIYFQPARGMAPTWKTADFEREEFATGSDDHYVGGRQASLGGAGAGAGAGGGSYRDPIMISSASSASAKRAVPGSDDGPGAGHRAAKKVILSDDAGPSTRVRNEGGERGAPGVGEGDEEAFDALAGKLGGWA